MMPLVTITPLILRVTGSTVTEPVPLELRLLKSGFSWARVRNADVFMGACGWDTPLLLLLHPAVTRARNRGRIKVLIMCRVPVPKIRDMFNSFWLMERSMIVLCDRSLLKSLSLCCWDCRTRSHN